MRQTRLDTHNHDRDAAGMTYVYPVVSRRAGGVSLGINLNVNNACNWRCIYCQVPDLRRGGPPPLDLELLEEELRRLLTDILHGDFMTRRVPEGMRRLNDIALSGNGEPTSAREFPAVMERLERVLADFHLAGRIDLVLISNGSLMSRDYVQDGLRRLAALGGQVWFKLDRADAEGIRRVNDSAQTPAQVRRHLDLCRRLCPTWVQTCMFTLDGAAPTEAELTAWLRLLADIQREGPALRGVLLYGLARPSMQPEAPRLGALPAAWLETLAARVRALGLPVRVFA